MIKSYTLDLHGSIELQKKCPAYAIPKECYKNVYHIAVNTNIFQNRKWNEKCIAFGYINSVGFPIAIRHAFFIIDNQAIDPTLIICESIYYIAEIFSLSEYCSRILKSGYYDMHNDVGLIEKEKILMKALKDKEICNFRSKTEYPSHKDISRSCQGIYYASP